MINIQSSNPLARLSGAEKKANTHTNVNAATLYHKNNVNTASPAELTLMLYDGAIKFCSMAIMALDKGDLEECNKYVAKTKKIIVEFRMTLDFNYDVADDFDRVYDYIHWVLTQGNVKKDKSLLEEALKQIRGMRDTWKNVMQVAKEAPKSIEEPKETVKE